MSNVIVLAAVFLAGGVLGVFAMVLIGIRSEERHMSLGGAPRTPTGATRLVLGVHVRRAAEQLAEPQTARR